MSVKEATMRASPVRMGSRCIYCEYYQPGRKIRCWGFTAKDVKSCINQNHNYYRKRVRKNVKRNSEA